LLAASIASQARAAGMSWRLLTRAKRQAAALKRKPDGKLEAKWRERLESALPEGV